jgi:hypothetical protein
MIEKIVSFSLFLHLKIFQLLFKHSQIQLYKTGIDLIQTHANQKYEDFIQINQVLFSKKTSDSGIKK